MVRMKGEALPADCDFTVPGSSGLARAEESQPDVEALSHRLHPFGYAFSSIRRYPRLPCSRICPERLCPSRPLWTSVRIPSSAFSERLYPWIEHRRKLQDCTKPSHWSDQKQTSKKWHFLSAEISPPKNHRSTSHSPQLHHKNTTIFCTFLPKPPAKTWFHQPQKKLSKIAIWRPLSRAAPGHGRGPECRSGAARWEGYLPARQWALGFASALHSSQVYVPQQHA